MTLDAYDWHDFYRGRGADALYLGSVQTAYAPLDLLVDHGFLPFEPHDGKPDAAGLLLRFERTARRIFDTHAGVRQWPHGYRTSAESAWSWHLESGALFVYRRGTPYLTLTPLAKRVSGTAFPVVTR